MHTGNPQSLRNVFFIAIVGVALASAGIYLSDSGESTPQKGVETVAKGGTEVIGHPDNIDNKIARVSNVHDWTLDKADIRNLQVTTLNAANGFFDCISKFCTEGHDAYKEGKAISDNPYSESDSKASADWEMGWNAESKM